MAKYKGKSERRIKDWHRRYADGEAENGHDARKQGFSRRAVKLPADRLQAPEENLDLLPKAEGLVVGFYPGGAIVRIEEGELLCGVAKIYRAPAGSSALAVGDSVTVALTRDEHKGTATQTDKDRADGMILVRAPRRTALTRPQPTGRRRIDRYKTDVFEKVIAANIDLLVIVASTRLPPLRHGLIDRFLIIAERGELTPVLVVNKIDLGRPDRQVLGNFQSLGVETILSSALTGEGLEPLRRRLAGKRSVLAGASGAGKTSLINAIVPGADAATQTVRAKDQRGRHTTSAAVVYDLPAGGLIVDTPGLRELALQFSAEQLPWYFPEFEAFAGRCRFNNCTHTHEPDCAVIAAVQDGKIPSRRYDGYLRILATIQDARG